MNGLYEGLISVGDSYYYGTDFITRPEVGGEDIQTRMVGDRTENFYRLPIDKVMLENHFGLCLM